jgi:hypothetical protein
MGFGSVDGELGRERERGKPEQQPEEQPKETIEQEIFVSHHASICGRDEQEKRAPEDNKSNWKPGSSFQLLYNSPRGEQDGQAYAAGWCERRVAPSVAATELPR